MDDPIPTSQSAPDSPWRWCREPEAAAEVARFFVAHADPSYISHSELQFGRASAVGRWSGDLLARIEGEAARAIAGDPGTPGMRCALARSPDGIAGLAFVRFADDAEHPFAVLEDLLVDPARRGGGWGSRFLAWIETECASRGVSRLFLESGIANHAAHRFFERQGFAQTSIVMMRDLRTS